MKYCAQERNASSTSMACFPSSQASNQFWMAVRWITEREKGGVLLPEETCTKTGERVMEVLRTKHPDARPPSAESLDAYPDNLPEMVPVNITDDVVTAAAGRLSGGAGPGGGMTRSVSNIGSSGSERRLGSYD